VSTHTRSHFDRTLNSKRPTTHTQNVFSSSIHLLPEPEAEGLGETLDSAGGGEPECAVKVEPEAAADDVSALIIG